MVVKLSKVMLVCAVAFHALLVFINNITDYDSNYQHVVHVLSMDTTFPNNQLLWRGLTLGIVLWFTGFITIGGEWFLMWQSHTWNGINASFRMVAIFALVLIYLAMDEKDTPK